MPEPVRPPAAREAASVILARHAPDGPEVLLLQRHPASRFSPGAFAFPGGRLEPADSALDVGERCRGLTGAEAGRRMPDVRPVERALAFWVAALREAFEEAGILLAYGPDGAPVDVQALGDALTQRARCREDSVQFGRLLVERDLRLATDRVAYWAHWITPEERPVRYDTRFFVTAVGADQVAQPDGLEMVSACWVAPAEALARQRAGELVLPIPTRAILAAISEHRTVDALLAAARRQEVRPVRPRIVREGGVERILLPDDPGWF